MVLSLHALDLTFTSPLESSGIGRDQSPFWSPRVQRWSSAIWLPSVGDEVERIKLPHRWFDHTVNYQSAPTHRNWRSSISNVVTTPAEKTEALLKRSQSDAKGKLKKRKRRDKARVFGGRKKPRITITRTIGLWLYPNQDQKTLLRQWLGVCRFIYNWVVKDYRSKEYLEEEEGPGWERHLLDHNDFRRRRREWEATTSCQRHWISILPYATGDEIIKSAIIARTEVISRNRENFQDRRHQLKWAALKATTQTITIRSDNLGDGLKIYPTRLHTSEMHRRTKTDLPNNRPLHPMHPERMKKNNGWPNADGHADNDCKLTYFRRLGRWKLAWVYEKDRVAQTSVRVDDNQVHERIVAIDPGYRTFATFYSPDHHAGKVCSGDYGRIVRLCHYMDDLNSRRDREPHRYRRWKMRIALARMRRKIRELIDEVHKQTVNWLVKEYDTVIIPQFDTHDMIRRTDRRVNSKVARGMMNWAHARFRDRLYHKLAEFTPESGKRMVMSSEAYTSMTCGNCGWIHYKLGGSKVFNCLKKRGGCGAGLDRDVNGARNIFLRALIEGTI